MNAECQINNMNITNLVITIAILDIQKHEITSFLSTMRGNVWNTVSLKLIFVSTWTSLLHKEIMFSYFHALLNNRNR